MQRPIIALLSLLFVVAGCDSAKAPASDNVFLDAAMQNVANLASRFRVTRMPGHFSVAVDGAVSGDHWDAQGRRFGAQLSIVCHQRTSSVRLSFLAGLGASLPLASLRAQITTDGSAPNDQILERSGNSYVMHGGLPLVHRVLSASEVVVRSVTTDRKPIDVRFAVDGMRQAVTGSDFYCARQWLAEQMPAPRRVASFPIADAKAIRVAGDPARFDALRAGLREVDGVTSVALLEDGTVFLGMRGADASRMAAALTATCDALGLHPDLPGQIEIMDTAGSSGRPVRAVCPR